MNRNAIETIRKAKTVCVFTLGYQEDNGACRCRRYGTENPQIEQGTIKGKKRRDFVMFVFG